VWNDPQALCRELSEIERLLKNDKRTARHELSVQKEIMACLVCKARDWLCHADDPGCKEVANARRHLGELRMVLMAPCEDTISAHDTRRDEVVRSLRNSRYALLAIEGGGQELWRQVLDEMRHCWDRLRVRFAAYRLHLVVREQRGRQAAECYRSGLLGKLETMESALGESSRRGEKETHDLVYQSLGGDVDEGNTALFDAVRGLCQWDAEGCHQGTEEEEARVYAKHH
jgi:hypothetical protein